MSPNSPDHELDPRRWKALALLCSAFALVTIDASIVLVAAPTIGSELDFSAGDLQWVMSAYMLSFGGLLLLGGRAADILGRRRLFMAGVALFGLASFSAGFATSPAMLIGARVVQGVGAAIMTPTALSIISATFPEGGERNKALAIWASVGGFGGSVAWLLGGVITDGLGWEWIFFFNVPIVITMVALAPALLNESRDRSVGHSFDAAGAVTVTAGLVALVYGVVNAPEAGWASGETLGLFALAAVLIAAFVAIESRAEAPLAPLRVFRSRQLVGGNLLLLALGCSAAGGMPFVLSEYAQKVLDWSPSHFGIAFVAMPIMVPVGSAIAQALASRGGVRGVGIAGMALVAVSLLLLTGVPVDGTYFTDILPGLVLFGIGLGFAFTVGTIASLAGVAEEEAGLASGLNNASFQIGGAIGVAVLSTVMLSDADGANRLEALTSGADSAFAAAIAFAVVGILVAALLLGPKRKSGLARRRPAKPELADRRA